MADSEPERSASTSIFEISDFPSKNLAYPPDIRVFANSYVYGEVRLLSNSILPLYKQYEIMLRNVDCEGMAKEDLTLYDFHWLSLYRKLSSMGAQEYEIAYYCPKCDKQHKHKFTLNDISFSDLEVPKLPLVAEFKTIGKHTFMPLTVGAFIDLAAKDKLHIKEHGEYLLDATNKRITDGIAIMAKLCTSMPYDEAYKVFAGLSYPEDQAILEEIDSLLDHGIAPLEFTCSIPLESDKHPSLAPKCGHKIVVDLLGGESLILPFREHRDTIKDRISFGS